MAQRLIIGNLDFEQCLLAEARGKTIMRYPQHVRQQISQSAALLAAFGRAGDVLWTEEDLSLESFDEPLRGALDRLELRSGASALVESLQGRVSREVLCWGMTKAIEEKLKPPKDVTHERSESDDPQWLAELWDCRTSAMASATCNHRSFVEQAEIGQWPLSTGFPFRRYVSDSTQFDAALRELVANHPSQEWVAKPSYSAAGRKQLRGRGPTLSIAERTRVDKHLEKYAGLLVESWVDRVFDFGVSCVIGKETHLLPRHYQQTHDNGGFIGIAFRQRGSSISIAEAAEREIKRCAENVAHALRSAGYRGPCTIDGYGYRRPDGSLGFQPLGEINARISFGLVAHAWGQRLGEAVILQAAPPRIQRG